MYLLIKLIDSLKFDLKEIRQYHAYYKDDELLGDIEAKLFRALEQATALREMLLEINRLEYDYRMDA